METEREGAFRRILVPLDGSHLAEAVLPLVEQLGTAPGTSVLLLHVLERHAPAAVHGERHLRSTEEAETYLRSLADRLAAGGVSARFHAHEAPEGDVARSIVQHAEEMKADLIALATHGQGGMRDVLFGSIAQQVVNRGSVPVLLTRPERDGETSVSLERILVPLDGTRASETALPIATGLAHALGSAVHLVVVVPTQSTVSGNRVAAATLLPATTRALLDAEARGVERYLRELSDGIRRHGVSVTSEVLRGTTVPRLVEESQEPGVGLVVVATHGRAGLQAFWAGSVASRLLTKTNTPVLLVRQPER